ncbi:MAG TPA: response regulator [Chloroflexota bacterium]
MLIIDDDRDLLELMAFVLSAEGFDVETAGEGREALDKVGESMPGLILLDMKMPVMNGWEFAAEFHRRHGAGIPIVVVTAAENAEKRAEEIGASGWVSKPFDVGYLVRVVRRHLAAT